MKINWKKILIFTFLIGAVVWAGKGIFKYSVFSTHDGNHHVARVYDVIKTVKEGQLPLRWAGSLNYGCGVPIYNFYYPLIYYLSAIIYFFAHDVVFSLKIINFASLLFGTVFFYLWIKSETKKELPAVAGALTYLYAPYRFSLIFVRGSPEYLAYAILPIVLYLYSLCFGSKDKKFIIYAFAASVMGAILTISHNFAAMFLMPIILLYLIVKIFICRLKIKNILLIAFSFLGAFGMGSFFIGPALLEQKFTRIGHSFLEWKDHFPTLWQLIRSKWGYFYSSSGTANDGMSFMLGYAQWLILGIAGIFIVYQIFKNKFKFGKIINENVWVIFYFLASIFTIYLILPISIPLWEKIKFLQQVQFSWRLLGVGIFTTSALFAFVLEKISSKKLYIGLFIFISFLTVIGTRNFMLPQPVSVEDLPKFNDFEKLHPERFSSTTMGDEIAASSAKGACWFDVPLIATDKEKLQFEIVERGNSFGSVKFILPNTPKGKTLTTGLGYFPGIYKFEINGKISSYSDCGGRVCFPVSDLRKGENILSWKIIQSPTENIFNYITLAFIAVWLLILLSRLTGIYKNKQKLLYFIFTVIIFLIFIFFRSYNLTGRIGFGWDQERDAWATTNILSGKLTLLGPRVQGLAGFFLPPYFFYILAPFYGLTHFSPWAGAYFIIFSSIVFFALTFLVLSRIFNKKIAMFFIALWAVDPLSVSIDTIAWNPVVIPLLFMILVYLNYLYFESGKKMKYAALSGIVFGLGASFHLQFLLTAPIFVPMLTDIFRNKRFKELGGLVILPALAFFPIVIFDLRHQFLNLKQLIIYLTNVGAGINRVFVVWGRFTSFVTGGLPPELTGPVVYILILAGYLILSRLEKNINQRKIISGLGLVWAFSLPLFYFGIKNPSEYYFNYLMIPLILLLSVIIYNLKRFGIPVLIGLVIYLAFPASPLLRSVALGLEEKEHAVVFLSKITKNSSPFNVSFDVPFNEDAGFRYLLNYHGVKYTADPKEPLIEFIIPFQKRAYTFSVGRIGIYIPSDWLKDNWLQKIR